MLASPVVPHTIDDRFVLEAEAASGGMGTVYRGRDLTTGTPVAIKIIRRAGVTGQKRFDREASILAELAHPAIVRYVAHGVLVDGSLYLVMDWIDGELLDHRMQHPGLSAAETLTVARRVADALAFAHARGVVHRDIKPSNLIAPDRDLERLTVIDFGVARASAAGSLTETGAVIGTPSYMAPEQVRGERALGPPADMFALGCVLYACLTGRVTFQSKRFLALRAKIMFWEPPPPSELAPEVPPALDELVMRMLSKTPAVRPQDGAELLALLDALPPLEPRTTQLRRARLRAEHPTQRMRPGASFEEPSRRVSIVVATSAESLEAGAAATPDPDSDPSVIRDSLEDSMLAYGAALDVMPDGAMIATLTDAESAEEQARLAVKCAQSLRARFPDSFIGVGTGDVRAEEEADLIDDIVQALAKDAMASLFADSVETELPAGCIRLDDRTAALVERDFALIRARGAIFVRGEKTE